MREFPAQQLLPTSSGIPLQKRKISASCQSPLNAQLDARQQAVVAPKMTHQPVATPWATPDKDRMN